MAFLPYSASSLRPLCDELDAWRTRLDREGSLSRRWSGRLRRDLEAEAVAASLSMEQVPVTVDEVRRILAGDRPASVQFGNEALVRGYRDAMEFVLRQGDDAAFRWDRGLIVGLHDRVLAANYAAGAGRLAAGPRWVIDGSTGEELYVGPEAADVPGLLDRACAAIDRTRDHPAILSAWAHVALAAIHPFRDGNGRVARVVASLAMYRGDFRRREFTSLEEWWGRHRSDYYGAFACLGRRFDACADVTPFIEAHVRAQLSQVRALDLRQRVERRIWEALERIVEDLGFDARAINALWDAFFGRTVTAGYYRPVADVSPATATRDLVSLTAAGLLVAHGRRRGRTYGPGQELFERAGSLLGVDVPEHDAHTRIVAVLTRELRDGDSTPGEGGSQAA